MLHLQYAAVLGVKHLLPQTTVQYAYIQQHAVTLSVCMHTVNVYAF